MSTLDHTLKPEATEVRRLEVISGTGRRRHFSEDFKAQVVDETLVAGAVASEVARRHGLTPQQVFTWRRQARVSVDSKTPQFVPAVVDSALPSTTPKRRRQQLERVERTCGSIEVEIEGVTVRIGHGADTKTIAAVLRALKASE